MNVSVIWIFCERLKVLFVAFLNAGLFKELYRSEVITCQNAVDPLHWVEDKVL